MGFKRQLTNKGDLAILVSQQKYLSSSTSMNVNPAHKSSQVNSHSTLNLTMGASLALNSGLSRPKGKFKKNEEGFDGLPEVF
jgi:hypothetical protein